MSHEPTQFQGKESWAPLLNGGSEWGQELPLESMRWHTNSAALAKANITVA